MQKQHDTPIQKCVALRQDEVVVQLGRLQSVCHFFYLSFFACKNLNIFQRKCIMQIRTFITMPHFKYFSSVFI